MTYLVIFNGPKYGEEKIYSKTWQQFMEQLNRIVEMYGQPPDLIYQKDGRIG